MTTIDNTAMLSVEEALQRVLDQVGLMPVETVGLIDSVGRIVAEDLVSDATISPFDNSAMDGFAVRAADLDSASEENPVVCDVIAEVPAGAFYDGAIEAGQAVRIMTGAPVPEQADAVVKYEIVRNLSLGGRVGGQVAFMAPVKPGNNIRMAGEEIKAGEVVIARGERVGEGGLGFLASCGITQVPVYTRPRVAIIPIGSELVSPEAPLERGKIRDGNSATLSGCVIAAGGIPVVHPIVSDDLEELAAAVLDAVETADFVVTSGGASDGDFDFIKPVVEEQGELLMTLVSMRPGKAQTFGVVCGVPVFGLPGNPAAAYCGFEVLIRQALRKMQGHTTFGRPTVMARLATSRKKKDPRRLYLRATLRKDADGELTVYPDKKQSSGLFGAIQRGNCLAVIPEETTFADAGTMVECVLLDVEEGVVL